MEFTDKSKILRFKAKCLFYSLCARVKGGGGRKEISMGGDALNDRFISFTSKNSTEKIKKN